MQLSTGDSVLMTQAAYPTDLDYIASTVKEFLRDMKYSAPDIDPTNEELEAAMLAEMEARNLPVDYLKRTVHLCASLIELAYHDLNLDEKKNIALMNWYMVYIDDMASKDSAPFSEFAQRFLHREPQLDPVLDAFVDVLLRIRHQYEPPCANSIVASIFAFVNFTCIEPEVEIRPLIQSAERFPWYLRERTGVAEAFSFFIFTTSRNINIMQYIQAMPDMIFWISLTNDLLSFYKEELAGDKFNYVNARAFVEKKTPHVVLTELKHELRLSRDAISATLANSPDALKAWQIWEHGYVMWHLTQDRYKLKDLGL